MDDITAQLQEAVAARREVEHQFRRASRKWDGRQVELEAQVNQLNQDRQQWQATEQRMHEEMQSLRQQLARVHDNADQKRDHYTSALQRVAALESRVAELETDLQESRSAERQARDSVSSMRQDYDHQLQAEKAERQRLDQHCKQLLDRLGDEENKSRRTSLAMVCLAALSSQTLVEKASLDKLLKIFTLFLSPPERSSGCGCRNGEKS